MSEPAAVLLHAWLGGLPAIVALAVACWLASLPLRDASLVDRFWSLLFVAAGASYALAAPAAAPRRLLLLAMLLAWALRLAGHITWRNWGHGEDRRYQAIRARNQPGFAWKSLVYVFLLQALLAWVISLPLLGALRASGALGVLDALGALAWLAGFLWEALADWQLLRFRAGPRTEGAVLDTGLWRYSRHPNYFGESLVWWGFFLVALGGGAWWSLPAPLLMTFMLLKVSGVALLEQDIAGRRPAYRDYVARTNAFLPGPPRVASSPARPGESA
jgi:steroid 5-alpha reductase family enzyme